jgi:hypothetical protein
VLLSKPLRVCACARVQAVRREPLALLSKPLRVCACAGVSVLLSKPLERAHEVWVCRERREPLDIREPLERREPLEIREPLERREPLESRRGRLEAEAH